MTEMTIPEALHMLCDESLCFSSVERLKISPKVYSKRGSNILITNLLSGFEQEGAPYNDVVVGFSQFSSEEDKDERVVLGTFDELRAMEKHIRLMPKRASVLNYDDYILN